MKIFNYKREQVNTKQLKEALRTTNNFILINLLNLSTVQKNNRN